MQSVPLVVSVVVWLIALTMARAFNVGVGIAWTICPAALGSNDILVVSQFAVFWVISTTTQGPCVHTIGRESRDRTVPQLSDPDAGTRHTFVVAIV
jgi:hypothetical protein